jgi:peptide deformylase
MLLDIKKYGEQVLRKKAAPVTVFDAALKETADNMFETMYANNGIGLAANQVGILKQILVLDASRDEKPEVHVLVNPVITENSREKNKYEEGCLSFPGVTEVIERPAKIKIKAQDVTGKPKEFTAEGLLAVVCQHEIDHLNGVLFIDRMSPVRKLMHNKELKEIKATVKKK